MRTVTKLESMGAAAAKQARARARIEVESIWSCWRMAGGMWSEDNHPQRSCELLSSSYPGSVQPEGKGTLKKRILTAQSAPRSLIVRRAWINFFFACLVSKRRLRACQRRISVTIDRKSESTAAGERTSRLPPTIAPPAFPQPWFSVSGKPAIPHDWGQQRSTAPASSELSAGLAAGKGRRIASRIEWVLLGERIEGEDQSWTARRQY